MNERIKELAEKSYYECPQVTSYMWENDIVPPEQWTKFAELIVKECATICKDTAEKQFNPLYSRESDGATVCYKKIVQHFGVEE